MAISACWRTSLQESTTQLRKCFQNFFTLWGFSRYAKTWSRSVRDQRVLIRIWFVVFSLHDDLLKCLSYHCTNTNRLELLSISPIFLPEPRRGRFCTIHRLVLEFSSFKKVLIQNSQAKKAMHFDYGNALKNLQKHGRVSIHVLFIFKCLLSGFPSSLQLQQHRYRTLSVLEQKWLVGNTGRYWKDTSAESAKRNYQSITQIMYRNNLINFRVPLKSTNTIILPLHLQQRRKIACIDRLSILFWKMIRYRCVWWRTNC